MLSLELLPASKATPLHSQLAAAKAPAAAAFRAFNSLPLPPSALAPTYPPSTLFVPLTAPHLQPSFCCSFRRGSAPPAISSWRRLVCTL